MIVPRERPIYEGYRPTGTTNIADIVQNVGNTDYIQDGEIIKYAPTRAIMVESQSDLASLLDEYGPGSIAYVAGFEHVWQLDASGNWVSVV